MRKIFDFFCPSCEYTFESWQEDTADNPECPACKENGKK